MHHNINRVSYQSKECQSTVIVQVAKVCNWFIHDASMQYMWFWGCILTPSCCICLSLHQNRELPSKDVCIVLCGLLEESLASEPDNKFFNATILTKTVVDFIRRLDSNDADLLPKFSKRVADFVVQSSSLFLAAEHMGSVEVAHKNVLAKKPGHRITIGVTLDVLVDKVFLTDFASWIFPPWRFYVSEVTHLEI